MPRGLKQTMRDIEDALGPIWDILVTIGKSLDPDNYHRFAKRSIGYALSYLLVLVTLSTLILGLISIPAIVSLQDSIQETLSQFETLELQPEFSTSEAVTISLEPLSKMSVVIDTSTGTNLTGETTESVLVDADSFTMKKQSVYCSLRSWISSFTVFGAGLGIPEDCYEEYSIAEFTDLLAQKEKVSKLLWLGMLYSLPMLFLVLVARFFLSFLALVLVAMFAADIVLKPLKAKLRMKQVFKLALYALTISVIVEIVTVPFQTKLYGIHWLISLGYFVLGLYLAGGDEKEESAKQPLVKKEPTAKKEPAVKGEKKPDIWKNEPVVKDDKKPDIWKKE